MDLTVEIVASGGSGPPAGVPVIVQIQDAGYQDALSTTVAETRTTAGEGEVLARAHISFERCASKCGA